MPMNPRVFREYDIRGVAESDFPDDFVADLGRATGAYFADAGVRRVTLGRDCRISSPRIHSTFKRELLAAGIDVVDVGVVHSPGLYFSVFHLGVEGGVMITASHNPSEDNGFKIVCGKSTIYGAEIQKLRERIEKRAFRTDVAPGRATDHDIISDYVAYIADNIKLGPRRIKVVVDGGNGTGAEQPILPTPPVLAGQHEDYLEQALTAYRNGRRKNAVMDSMAQLLTSDEDVKIAAAYFADQPSPLATATTTSK